MAEPRKSRKNNPEKTRENILQEAIVEFVQQGLSGARVDAIAERIHLQAHDLLLLRQ
jgi:AcrR family transcriptional regulator